MKVFHVALLLSPWCFLAALPARAQDVWPLPPAKAGVAYMHRILVDNPRHLTLHYKHEGNMPPGIDLSDDGVLSGKPARSQEQPYQLKIVVSDGTSDLISGVFTLLVAPPDIKFLPQQTKVQFVEQTPGVHVAGEEARAVVGFQQVGTSGADSSQKFFLDFYLSRPVPVRACCDSPLRWWGNVRIASAPRQIDSAVSAALPASGAPLKFNELAQAAEFLSGVEFRLSEFRNPLWGQNANLREGFRLGLILSAGAAGELTAQKLSNYPVYSTPADPAELALFQKQFPAVGNRAFVQFVPPARDHFFLEYLGGFQLSTYYADRNGTATTTPPAMVSITFGQNELVTGGRLRGIVNRVEAFYPLSTGRNDFLSSIYLFATAQLQLTATPNNHVFFLQTPTTVPADASIAVIAAPSKRDVYSIGLGIDLVNILKNAKISWKPQ